MRFYSFMAKPNYKCFYSSLLVQVVIICPRPHQNLQKEPFLVKVSQFTRPQRSKVGTRGSNNTSLNLISMHPGTSVVVWQLKVTSLCRWQRRGSCCHRSKQNGKKSFKNGTRGRGATNERKIRGSFLSSVKCVYL